MPRRVWPRLAPRPRREAADRGRGHEARRSWSIRPAPPMPGTPDCTPRSVPAHRRSPSRPEAPRRSAGSAARRSPASPRAPHPRLLARQVVGEPALAGGLGDAPDRPTRAPGEGPDGDLDPAAARDRIALDLGAERAIGRRRGSERGEPGLARPQATAETRQQRAVPFADQRTRGRVSSKGAKPGIGQDHRLVGRFEGGSGLAVRREEAAEPVRETLEEPGLRLRPHFGRTFRFSLKTKLMISATTL